MPDGMGNGGFLGVIFQLELFLSDDGCTVSRTQSLQGIKFIALFMS